MTNFEISVRVFLQLALLLISCRVVGRLVRPLGQPQVVAEMITGVLLGPSLLGLLFPDLQAWLFPQETLVVLYALAQVGLALYMFLVGLEFDLGLLRQRGRSAIAVSLAGIVAPFLLGGALAWQVRDRYALFADTVRPLEAILFLAAAMSITAFPMLARIIVERGLAGTSLGTLTLAAGSLDDAIAWCFLALVLAMFGGTMATVFLAVGGGALYALLVFLAVRPVLKRLLPRLEGGAADLVLPVILALLCLAAWITDVIGIYMVFGAFILGAAMPRDASTRRAREQIEPLTTTFLLPCFFVYSGLNTQISLLAAPDILVLALVVLLVAVVAKGGACALAARWSGEPWRDAFAIGALMNARGLMELILLNIGLERGVITPTLFTVMVLMAVVTTLMAVPLFNLAFGRRGVPAAA